MSTRLNLVTTTGMVLGVRELRRRALTRQSVDLVTLVDARGIISYSSPA